MYYKYFLVDSVQKEGRKIYKIRFHPKGKSIPVFRRRDQYRFFDLGFGVRYRLRMVKGLNVNWIRDLVIENTNELVNDSTWFLKQDKIMADFTVQMKDSSKLISFMGHRQIDYSRCEGLTRIFLPEIARVG